MALSGLIGMADSLQNAACNLLQSYLQSISMAGLLNQMRKSHQGKCSMQHHILRLKLRRTPGRHHFNMPMTGFGPNTCYQILNPSLHVNLLNSQETYLIRCMLLWSLKGWLCHHLRSMADKVVGWSAKYLLCYYVCMTRVTINVDIEMFECTTKYKCMCQLLCH